ncbi:SiaB family protein kinase [Paracrocinitomix mangrovi]|uniref:SiaB family protein kinase n=1 Tax=Paracrocinitomix mangrovi TaxID=2862509 RepID=UPI001C8D4863|nr:SiaB family protein kinase [Paracrocinitomix mangrovi]UKN02975.1 SiaB family protein kinase [Paracrocinitomix mangrovi]
MHVLRVDKVYEIYKQLEEKHVLLSFKGMITSELLTTILQIMESKMEHMDEKPKVKRKVFNILVECLQNLYHHIDQEDRIHMPLEDKSALLMIAKREFEYEITTGNYMKAEDVQPLKEKLDLVNSMNKDELKAYYKQVLSEGSLSQKGTAGLGMIDIARKSGEKLDYNFSPINDTTTFFSLSVKIAE